MLTDKSKLSFLSLFRIFFALSITTWHLVGCQFGFSYQDYPVLNLFRYLTVCGGNQVFFLISGMLFYLVYYPRLVKKSTSCAEFLIGRAITILPLVTIGTLLAFLFTVLRDHPWNFTNLFIDLFFLGNTLIKGGYGNYNTPIWYIAVLFACYIVSAIIFKLTKEKAEKWFILPLILGFCLVIAEGSLQNFLHGQVCIGLYNYFLGFYFMKFLKRFENLRTTVKIITRLACLIIASLVLYLFIKEGYSCEKFGPCDISFNLVIWIPLFTSLYALKTNVIIENKFFNYLGNLSLYIYVLHVPVNLFYSFLIEKIKFSLSPILGLAVYYLILIFCAILAKLLVPKLNKVLEKNFLPLKEKDSNQI